MSGGYLEGVRKVSGGYLECVWKVTGKSQDSVWKVSKLFCHFVEFWNVRLAQFPSLYFVKLNTELLNLAQLELNGLGFFLA